MNGNIRSLVSKVLRTRSGELMFLAIIFLVLIATLPRRKKLETRTLLIAPVGEGNIGDSALYQACISSISGPLVCAVSSISSFPNFRERLTASEIEVPHLYSAPSGSTLRSVRLLCKELSECTNLRVVGADMMDGAYSEFSSAVLWTISFLSALKGYNTAILGFSWNGRPTKTVGWLARKSYSLGVNLFLRDPVSLERIQALVGGPCTAVSDVVFSLNSGTLAKAANIDKNEVKVLQPFAILNVSGLLLQDQSLPDYLESIAILNKAGLTVLLLPHVFRAGTSDLRAQEHLASMLPDFSRVSQIVRELNPADVSYLVSKAEIVISGRMHLGVLALNAGTPALLLASQGKVEGLMRLFRKPGWALKDSRGLLKLLQKLGPSVSHLKTQETKGIQQRLLHVKRLSSINFEQ